MDKQFKEILSRLFKRFLDEVVFIELKKNTLSGLAEIPMPEHLVLPVYIEELAQRIKVNDIEYVPPLAIIKGMVYVIGAGADIPHVDIYKAILKKIDINIAYSIIEDAFRLAEEMHYPNALLYLNAALEMDHENLDALYNLGRVFDVYSEAESRPELKKLSKYCFEKCVEKDSTFALGHYHLGIIYYNDENFLKAESCWLTALKYDLPEDVREEVVIWLGRVRDRAAYEKGHKLILDGRVDEGLEILKSLEEDHDEWWNLLFFIGVGYRMLEQFEEALGYFLKVISLNTGHIRTMNEIGICLMALGDFWEAEKYFKEAMRLAPENAELICNMGILHLNRGDDETARSLFDRASRLAPEDEVIAMWLDHINKKLI